MWQSGENQVAVQQSDGIEQLRYLEEFVVGVGGVALLRNCYRANPV